MGFVIPLLDQDDGLSGILLHEATLAQGGPNQPDNIILVRGVRLILPCCCMYPGPHPEEEENHLGHHLLLRYDFINW